MTQPLFSLIFVNYRSAERLARSLPSWQRAFAGIAAEYIIVNNDTFEEQAVDAVAREAQACRVLHLGANYGFGQASNRGATLASGRYLFFLNPDTTYQRGSPHSLLALFQTWPRSIGGIGLIDRTGRPERWSAGLAPTFVGLLKGRLLGRFWWPLWEAPHFSRPDWVSGAALLIPRTLFQSMNGFDERFFLYFEDVDLCQRVRQEGGVVWRTPFFAVEHDGGGSQDTERSQKEAYFKSQRQYFAKHRPAWEGRALGFFQQLFFGVG